MAIKHAKINVSRLVFVKVVVVVVAATVVVIVVLLRRIVLYETYSRDMYLMNALHMMYACK